VALMEALCHLEGFEEGHAGTLTHVYAWVCGEEGSSGGWGGRALVGSRRPRIRQ